MDTYQKIETKTVSSAVVQAYYIALAVLAVPFMLGPTVSLMAVGTGQYIQHSRVRMAALPGCPPESYACGSYSEPATTVGEMNTTTQDLAGGIDSGAGDDATPAPYQGLPGDQGVGSPAGDGSQDIGQTDGSFQGNTGETGGISGNGSGAPAGKSLFEIVQEGLAFGEVEGFSSAIVTNSQCEFIKKGMKINSDADGDGLAQIPASENYPSIMQEDYYKTDSNDPDTDYDSYYDGEEVCNGADPLHPPDIKNIDWNLVNRLRGKIVIQTERRGEAWYVYPPDRLRYYLRNGAVAYKIMRFLSLGITDSDLVKIPVGIEPRFKDIDTDGDGLSDKMEEGLKTDVKNSDTDGDGINDGDEVLLHSSNPLGSGALVYDKKIIERSRGKILLQVESRGEAWYVSPADGKRYYMKDGNAAYQIMRFLSLGILNKDIDTMPIGTLMGKIK